MEFADDTIIASLFDVEASHFELNEANPGSDLRNNIAAWLACLAPKIAPSRQH
jgi:hypothetical protein